MPIDQSSPYWNVLSEHIRLLLTLPDPPPPDLRAVTEVVALTAISALSQRLSPEIGNQVRSAANAAIAKTTAAQAGR